MKKLMLGLGVMTVALMLVLSSCAVAVMSFSDNLAGFDGSGHVKTAVTYTTYGTNITTLAYAVDGTYEIVVKAYNGGSSSWMQSGGSKGTYSYDSKAMTMTYNSTQIWVGGTSGSYTTLSAGNAEAKTTVVNEMLGSESVYQLYTGSGSTYANTSSVTNWDDTSSTETITADVASDLSTIDITDELLAKDATGAVIALSSGKTVITYTVASVFPDSIKSLSDAKGKTFTIATNKSVVTPYSWNAASSSWTAGIASTWNSGETQTYFAASDLSFVSRPEFTSFLTLLCNVAGR